MTLFRRMRGATTPPALNPRRRLRAAVSSITAGGMAVIALVSVRGFGTMPAPGTLLTAGTDFTVTSSITAWPSCSGGAALFYPGVTRCITYTVKNNISVPITVLNINLTVDSTTSPTPPAGCNPSTNLDVSQANFSGTFAVGASPATAPSPGRQIAMRETNSNQDACKGVAFHFAYTGTARYTDPTTTTLASSQNPANQGQTVMFTATVSPQISQPVAGTVAFKDAGNPISGCGSIAVSGGTAQCSTAFNAAGTHPITASFTPTDSTNFSMSTSSTLNENVNTGLQNCNVTLGPGFVTITGTYKGNYEVKNGQSLYLNGGTITGNLQVDAGGRFG